MFCFVVFCLHVLFFFFFLNSDACAFVLLNKSFHCFGRAHFMVSFASFFQVMTFAQRDSFVEKTLSVKTGILKQSVNARAATLPSMGIPLTAKVGLDFIQLMDSCAELIITIGS